MATGIDPHRWKSFKIDVDDGEAICVVGTQFDSIDNGNNQKEPLYNLLAKHLYKKNNKAEISYTDHFYAAQSLYSKKIKVKGTSEKFVHREIREDIEVFLRKHAKNVRDSDLYKSIATLNVPLYINLAYDDILFEAIKKHSNRDPILLQPNDQLGNLTKPSVDKPIVFNLFGSIPVVNNNSGSLKNNQLRVLEKSLYSFSANFKTTGFIPKIIMDNIYYPSFFIGLGWNKWYVRMLMSLFIEAKNLNKEQTGSIAVEPSLFFSSGNNKEEKDSLLNFWDELAWMVEEANDTRLLKRLNELSKYSGSTNVNNKGIAIKPNKNKKIFVSFRTDALQHAQNYCHKLIQRGFDVVADKRLVDFGGTQEIIDNWILDVETSLTDCYAFVAILSDGYSDLSQKSGANPAQMELSRAIDNAGNINRPFIYLCGVDNEQRLNIKDGRSGAANLKNENIKDLQNDAEIQVHLDSLVEDVNKWGG